MITTEQPTKGETSMTTEQLTNLRWLLANGDTLAGSHELAAAAVNALPELLDAAEREQKLREALSKVLVGVCPASVQQQRLADNLESLCHEVYDIARAALAEGGAK